MWISLSLGVLCAVSAVVFTKFVKLDAAFVELTDLVEAEYVVTRKIHALVQKVVALVLQVLNPLFWVRKLVALSWKLLTCPYCLTFWSTLVVTRSLVVAGSLCFLVYLYTKFYAKK